MSEPPEADGNPASAPTEPAPERQRERTHPIFVFGNGLYRRMWISAFLAQLAQQGQRVISLYLVYELTDSAFMLGLLGIFQFVPLLMFSLLGGSLADMFDRKKLIVLTQVIRGAIAVALLGLQLAGVLNEWHLYAAMFLMTAGGVTERPAQQALLPTLVPQRQITGAILLNSVNNQLGRTLGPSITGILLGTLGVTAAYVLGIGLYVGSFVVALTLPSALPQREDGAPPPNVWQMMKEGLRYLLETQIILALLLLDTVATFFGAFEPLMPVFAKDVLGVGPEGLGALLTAVGVGAVLGVLGVLNFTWVRHKGRMVLVACFGYGLALIGFGLSPIFALSMFFAALLGALDQVNVTFRNTVLLLVTPDRLRGRVESIRMMFIIGAPGLGAMQAGAIANVIGAPATVTIEAFFVLAGVLLIAKQVRQVREIQL